MKRKFFVFLAFIVFLTAFLPFDAAYAEPTEVEVYLGGTHLSVDMVTDGLVVVGFAEVPTAAGMLSPAKAAGLAVGDVLWAIDDAPVRTRYDVQRALLAAEGGTVSLSVARDGQSLTLFATPAYVATDGYVLGVYLREGVEGVGTLTYVRAGDHTFAALGHGVEDPDTGGLPAPFRAKVYASRITDVVKGQAGEAGELRGTVGEGSPIGTVTANTPLGLYGHADEAMYAGRPKVKVASRGEVKEGDAVVVCALRDEAPRGYAVRITAVRRQSSPEPKGISLQVTDPRLLAATGGIVQGMSGSPILQNGRLVGAVTHVLVDDPTSGYGVYIDFMLAEG